MMTMEAQRIRRLQEEAEQERRERIAAMSPGERMEEAFRLFLMSKPKR